MTTFKTLRTLINEYNITFPEDYRFTATYEGREISRTVFKDNGYGMNLSELDAELDKAYHFTGEDLGYGYIDLEGCQSSYDVLKKWGHEVELI